ncbi:hypothetical protein ACFOGJ_24235 [Marinibaculum pumilum]|uniref:Type IV secretion system protein VirB5 n=1 Tax=Marinibaculum pumilum TaxID=1766165 RepID=A0ABV7L6Y5_9PROT
MAGRVHSRLICAAVFAAIGMGAPWSQARAAMEVHDSQNIVESAKAAAEAVKQTKELVAIKGFITDAKETLGPAVSLAMSIPGWVRESRNILQCIVPDPGTWLPQGDGGLGSLCDAQEAVREHLGLPTSGQLQGVIDSASGEVRGVFSVGGAKKGMWSEEADAPIDRTKVAVIEGRRRVAYEDAVFSAAATALALQNSVGAVSGEVEAIVSDTAGVDNINSRVAQTNRALASVLQELAATRAILAKLLELQALEQLNRLPVMYRGMPTFVQADK